MKIRFVSNNDCKIKEVQTIFNAIGVEVIPAKFHIEEIQTEDVAKLVRHKILQAFNKIGRPVFVEHTGLYIKSLNEFPGGLTQIFWDKLQADQFSTLFGTIADPSVVAKTTIGYCDSRQLHFFEGSISGRITAKPTGSRTFQWDCVFLPDGESQTFAENDSRKNEISMRKIAFDQFKMFLEKGGY